VRLLGELGLAPSTAAAQAKLIPAAGEVNPTIGGPGGARDDAAGRMLTVTLTNDLDGTVYA